MAAWSMPVMRHCLYVLRSLHSIADETGQTSVSFDPLKGTCLATLSRARMHSFRASRLLLISAPSRRVCLSLSYVSAMPTQIV